jgi:hypothetical protein
VWATSRKKNAWFSLSLRSSSLCLEVARRDEEAGVATLIACPVRPARSTHGRAHESYDPHCTVTRSTSSD